ncbi:MFS transporter [Halieaceae bacterium IMCC14734]|uniref:MFS transporter n=1 Tax=Candidatus Litorirhabdus singularis TaxID=2518993 RepID=A0ABT3TM14_9GAMM|nr:MFS transporter [Candidatus Litorirhabdus singularis]MCX2983059.1 MFS transporter [Candidatus Litorirhabdus singularis]
MFFGWYVVAGSLMAQLLVVGFFTYSVSLLVGPVRAEFSVSLEQVMYSLTIGTFAGMLVAPIAGAMLDRYPVRWMMCGGVLLFAGGLWSLGQTTSITQFVIIFGVTMALANALSGSMAASTIISRWFTASRGRALGISAIGTSLGGIIIPALMTYWLARSGWRITMENMSLLALFLVLPFIFFTVRGRPSDVGLEPEGGAPAGDAEARVDQVLGLKDILRHQGYWLIGLPLGILFCAYSAVLANLTPYATSLEHSAAQGSSLIMALAIASFAGKLAFGFMADRVPLKIGLWSAMALVTAALLILSALPGYNTILFAVVLMGLATGGMLPVWGSMMAQCFGLLSYGKAMGLMGPLITLSVMPGFTIIGRLYDSSGDYQTAMLVFAGMTIAAALIMIPLRLVTPTRAA